MLLATAQLRCAELHTSYAEMALDCKAIECRKQFSIAIAIKLHNFVVQSYNELLILDCDSTVQLRCTGNSQQLLIALAIKLHNFVVQEIANSSWLR